LIARLFASTYPDQVSGLVLVDPASEFLKSSLTPAQWATYIEATRKLIEPNGLEAPDHVRTLELLHGTPQVRAMPVVVLTSDKRFDFGAGGVETWTAWRTAQDRLAKLLNAKHVSDTNSGHAIQMEQPQLVIDAVRQVVDAVRDPTSWRRSETRQPRAERIREVLRNNRRQSQQSRLELGLRISLRFAGANYLDCGCAPRPREAVRCARG